jgi:heat shock protein HslJ
MSADRRFALSALVFFCALFFWAPIVGAAQAEVHRGYYVFGHEVRTFQPCGSDTVFWVKAEADISKQLREAHQKLTSKPYEPVYVEVKGYFADKAAAGFAADYEGQIVIEAVDLVRARQENDCSPVAAAQESLTGIVWKWQQTLLGDGQTAVPDNPDRYTIAFQPDGSLAIRADCNRVGGNYTIEETSLTIETTFSTRAMCPPDSLDQTFLKHLNAAAIYFMRQGALFIDLQADSGAMEFSK